MERKTKQQIKSMYSSVLTNLANVKTREQALKSSELALKATRFGYESDTRNIVDLLNAERNFSLRKETSILQNMILLSLN